MLHGDLIIGRKGSSSTSAFRALIDAEAIKPILEELLCDPVYGHVLPDTPPEHSTAWRLDHDYIDVSERMEGDESADLTTDGGGHGLHGGLGANHVTVVWELNDVGPEDGGAGTYPRHLPT